MYTTEILDEFASPEDLASSAFDCDPDICGLDSFDLAIDDIQETLLQELPFSPEYPSPEHSPPQTGGTADTQSGPQESTSKPKRKRENRYKNAPPSVLSRRRAQNRASQRAYRERKDQRIKDLEGIINDLERKNEVLSKAYENLKVEYWKLKAQYDAGSLEPSVSWDPSLPQFGDGILYYGDSTINITNYQV
ncbi:bZIP transcription factor [Xylaria castorea]|nr:bZIP transcription factor [Xylaria castorea]